MTQTVPLNKLVLSPRNVRKTNGDEDIAGLAESIASKGLLQNLVVSPAEKAGKFEVDAGGRRLRALNLLANRKDLPKNWPVPVMVIGRENATEASLAENLQKVAMNPADEVEAFAAIIESYADNDIVDERERIANCARRFGVTERHVRQRLALAQLAPDILSALRDGEITIAAATAYATHPDPAEQLKIFKSHQKRAGTYGKHDPREIRDALKGRIYLPDHRLVRYVGLDAYIDAGGRIEADLFFDEGERDILLDTVLLEKLAAEKAAQDARRLAQADGWLGGEARPVTGHSWTAPKAPQGYEAKWCRPAEIEATQRADTIAIYAIGEEGELALDSQYAFFKIEPREGKQAAGCQPMTQEQREALRRAWQIRYRAARLAAPKVAGTELEGRAFWPRHDYSYVDAFHEDEDADTVTVALLITIPKAELDAQLTEAERRFELEQQELREEAEALAAERAGAADPDEDEEADQDPNVNDMAPAEPEAA